MILEAVLANSLLRIEGKGIIDDIRADSLS